MVMCFAPTCKHYSEKHGCKFFVFPKDPIQLRKWISLIRRKDRDPAQHSRICSCHFVEGKRENGPTIFDYNIKKRFEPIELKTKPVIKRKKIVEEDNAPGPSGLQVEESQRRDVPSPPETSSENEPYVEPSGSSEITTTTQPQFSAMLEAENYYLRQEIERLRAEIQSLSIRFSFKHIETNNHLIRVYTGLPTKDIFLALYSLFENLELSYFNRWQVVKVAKRDQLLLTLMKLRLNLLNDDLAFRFGVSRETVANIFKTWLFALHEILFAQFMAKMPERAKNKLCMPASFSSFTNCRVIIDCTEVNTIHPSRMETQRITFSTYKHRNTLKALVGVAPNGVVVFTSKLYPGATSDKKVTIHSGILDQLKPGDLVLADKGFMISDVLPQGVSLNIPPFLTKPQFTPEQIVRTRTIARARIHVERAIARIKSYMILSMIPATLIPHAFVVFQVCAALTNLQFPLIREVETLYNY